MKSDNNESNEGSSSDSGLGVGLFDHGGTASMQMLESSTSLTHPQQAGSQLAKRKALYILGFGGALIILGSPFIPVAIKAQLIAGYALSVGATGVAGKIEENGKNKKYAEFIREVANFCLICSITSEFGHAIGAGLGNDLFAKEGLEAFSTIAARPIGAVIIASKKGGEDSLGYLQHKDSKSLFGVVLDALARGLISPYFIGLVLHTGKFSLPVFVIFVAGRTVIDLAFTDRENFTKEDYIQEIVASIVYNSLSFASMGLFDGIISKPLEKGIKNLTSSSLAGGIVSNIASSLYHTSTDLIIANPVKQKIQEYFKAPAEKAVNEHYH